MAFKMKGHTLPGIKQRKSTNKKDGRAASRAFQQGVSDDLIAQGQGESNENYQKRKTDFTNWVSENAGPGMNIEKAKNFANTSNSRYDRDPNIARDTIQKGKELERIERGAREMDKSALPKTS